ncbi:protein-L-isoaspartate O-methyltransferase family protein [Devosia sp. A449]
MVDFERARAHMVDSQLHTSGVINVRILGQMRALPRENFVPASRRDIAYVDDIHWFGARGASRFMAAPATLGKLLQLADIAETDAALDIGATTGYSTAVIAGLASSVIGIEADAALAAQAAANLAASGLSNASVVTGAVGQFGKARFDVIMVQGALASVPQDYIDALKDGGRLVAMVASGGVAVANVFVKSGGKVTARAEFNAFLPPLVTAPADQVFVF